MIAAQREQFLQRLALFSDLEASELRELAEVAQVVQFPASALIFREGETGDCAYVVVRGSVEVFAIDRNGDEVVLAQLKELDHVGEQSLLPGHSGRRNASLRACEDTTLLRIPRAEFQTILTQRQTLKDLLSQAGHQQVRANMIRTARLARIWALFMFINGFISIGILCGLAKVFRTPFIFPSLGATAFLVFFTPTTPAASPRNTLCGHAIGIACGYAALWVTGLQSAGPAIVTELGWDEDPRHGPVPGHDGSADDSLQRSTSPGSGDDVDRLPRLGQQARVPRRPRGRSRSARDTGDHHQSTYRCEIT